MLAVQLLAICWTSCLHTFSCQYNLVLVTVVVVVVLFNLVVVRANNTIEQDKVTKQQQMDTKCLYSMHTIHTTRKKQTVYECADW